MKPVLEVSEANLQGLDLKVVKVHSQIITHFKVLTNSQKNRGDMDWQHRAMNGLKRAQGAADSHT